MTLPNYTQTKTSSDTGVTVQGNLSQNSAVKMSVSEEGAAHIMSLLTDLYTNPEVAVLREYASNALDSHKADGQTKPIEIILPSNLDPRYIVRDFGVGMSPDDIKTIYSSYGASTKRNDFNQIGAFGLGCKSALTLTESFTLKSVKDGVQTVAVISRGEDGVGRVNVVSETQTDLANGVEVTIPIPNPNHFIRQADGAFYTWPKDSVLVNGTKPDSLFDDDKGIRKSPSGLFYHNFLSKNADVYRVRPTVIVGGIAYRVEHERLTDDWQTGAPLNLPVWIDIPIGSIDLTPSRDNIRYSPRTKKFLLELLQQVSAEVPEVVNNLIEQANSRQEVLQIVQRLHHNLYFLDIRGTKNGITWRGETVEQQFTFVGYESVIYNHGFETRQGNHFRYIYTGTPILVLKTDEQDEEAFQKLSQKMRRNLKDGLRHLYGEGQPKINILTVNHDDLDNNKWISENSDYTFMPLDDFIAGASAYRKANRNSTPRKASAVTYPVYRYDATDKKLVMDELAPKDISGEVYYINEESLPNPNWSNYLAETWDELKLGHDARVLILSKTREHSALEKRVKQSVPHLRTVVQGLLPKTSDLVEALLVAHPRIKERIKQINNLIDDDDQIQRLVNAIDEAEKIQGLRVRVGVFLSQHYLSNGDAYRGSVELDELYQRFPLLRIDDYSNLLTRHPEHAKLYIEAVINNEREAK